MCDRIMNWTDVLTPQALSWESIVEYIEQPEENAIELAAVLVVALVGLVVVSVVAVGSCVRTALLRRQVESLHREFREMMEKKNQKEGGKDGEVQEV